MPTEVTTPLRQRNDTTDVIFVQVADPPFLIQPGETVSYPSPIIGMTVLSDEDKPSADEPKAPKKAAKATSGEEPAE